FAVSRGEAFGFLGPNGAGKTTTIKILMGLMRPTGGDVRLFGRAVPDRKAREKVGFMPENPYVYPYLTPREFVETCARLSGLRGGALRDRVERVLRQTGIAYAAARQVRQLSKGMLQRTGLAAALVADPELLVLDEPMSGLDPGGRKEVRDMILEERRQGRTIFFSTHILADVPALCDHMAILQKGQTVLAGRLDELLRGEVRRTDVTIDGTDAEFREACEKRGLVTRLEHGRLVVEVKGGDPVSELLQRAFERRLEVLEVAPRYDTLEELFVRSGAGTDVAS
ncbi:MAG TPA: ABC transporter ATP-binding protein, partial [Polyangiaceae bacterium]|nr:ABC transporter ATP-binding protein [Polyangiaceae bacterium]